MDTTDVIRMLCQREGISVTNLEKEMGFANGSLTKGAHIRSDRLHMLAERFGVSMEFLYNGCDANTQGYDQEEMEKAMKLYAQYKGSIPQVQAAVEALLKKD